MKKTLKEEQDRFHQIVEHGATNMAYGFKPNQNDEQSGIGDFGGGDFGGPGKSAREPEFHQGGDEHYYRSQLDQIDFHSEYPPTFKINGEKNSTKWMNLNEVSAKALIEKLVKEFKLK